MREQRATADGDAFEGLRALDVAYAGFLHRRPGLTRLMFATHPSRRLDDDPEPDPLDRLRDDWRAAVAACVAAGSLPARDPRTVAIAIWSAEHGMLTLTRCS
ncbi:WHG domain-containing protein [Pseudonocardia sp. NPDC049154]|uniref:WHG domain-containing protein n=1 Tax=Pseudonocardia sp. NPDC049154 TaxID=3155501 RepID=UPI0033D84E2E